MKAKGFTLIELLVVIAIIAILAAILFPVFAMARETARQSSCLNNVKQISLAMMMYLDDNDDIFPVGLAGKPGTPALMQVKSTYVPQRNAGMPGYVYQIADGVDSGWWVNWMDLIFPYIKSVKIMVCPSSLDNTVNWWGGKQPISYGYNPYINGCISNSQPIVAINRTDLKEPASFIMVWDCNIAMGVAMSGYWAVRCMGIGSKWANPHKNGINIGLADGHAKWYKYDDEFVQKGAQSYAGHPDGMGCGSSPHWYPNPYPE